jgi:hypothetical protein
VTQVRFTENKMSAINEQFIGSISSDCELDVFPKIIQTEVNIAAENILTKSEASITGVQNPDPMNEETYFDSPNLSESFEQHASRLLLSHRNKCIHLRIRKKSETN